MVRLSRRHRVLCHRGDRHRALGPEGQGARPQRARPARRAGAREAAGDRLLPRPLRKHRGDGGGNRRMGVDRAARAEDRLRQARQCASRLRARSRRGLCEGDAGGARRQDADDRQRHQHQMGRDRRGAPRKGDGGIQPRLDRGAARRLGPGGLRQSARQDDDAHRLWRARMDARAVRARARDRNGRCRRRRSWPRRRHYRLQEGDRALRVLPPAGERACLVVGDRQRGEPRHLVQLASVQAVRVEAAAQSDAARPRHRAVRACGWMGLSAEGTGPRHRGHRRGGRRVPEREGAGGRQQAGRQKAKQGKKGRKR